MRRIFVLALLGLACNVYSQFSISGTVKNKSGEPLIGANVVLEKLLKGNTSNSAGEFDITGLKKGNYTIKVSYVGYKILEKSIVLNMDVTLDFVLEESHLISEEVVIKAIRADKNTPVAFTNLSKKTISDVYNGEHPVYFISELSPSIVTESESGTSFANYGSLRLRGLDQHRINITLNGVPLNDMIDHGVYFSNFTDIGNSFESVQIQRGVGTSSNGVASYAGSINFESINLERQSSGATAQLGYGSYNSARFNITVNSGIIKDHWAFHTSFSKIHSDGYRDNSQSDAYSFFFSGGYFSPKNIVKLNIFDARSKNGLAYSAVDKAALDTFPEFNPLNENDIDDFGQYFIQLQHIFKASENLNLASSLYYNGAGGDFPWSWEENGIVNQINYPLTNKHMGIISNIYFTGIPKLSLNGGLHAYTFKRENMEQIMPDRKNPYYYEESDKNEISLFVKANFTINKLSIYSDIQYRYAQLNINPDYTYLGLINEGALSPDPWSFISPKAGLVYNFNNNNNIYASAGLMSREPRKVDILGGYGLYDSTTFANLRSEIDFLHEDVIDIESGINHQGGNYSINLNVFYMYFRNGILESGETIAFGSKARSNVPKSSRKGIELSLNAQPVNNLNINSNVTYMKSEINEFSFSGESEAKKGIIPIMSPDLIYNGTINYNLMQQIDVGFSGKYVSKSFMTLTNENEFILPSYFVLNSRISIDFLKKHNFTLEINNLTSEKYYTNGAPVDTDGDWIDDAPGYFANAPLNFFGQFTLTF